jgi:hypothetical protein
VAVVAAAVGGFLIGGAGDGQRVDSLADAIELANDGALPTGRSSSSHSTSTTSGPADSRPPVVVSAVVTANSGADGTLTLSTRSGSLTLTAAQLEAVEAVQPLPGGVGNVPVGASVILFQHTFGPEASTASDYRLVVVDPESG